MKTARLMVLLAAAVLAGGCSQQRVSTANETLLTQQAEGPAASGRGQVQRLGSNRFSAGCPGFESLAAKQQTEVWCWAACAEMVHRWNGGKVTQAEIAERIHGAGVNASGEAERAKAIRAASFREVMRALSPGVYEQSLSARLNELGEAANDSDQKATIEVDLAELVRARVEAGTTNSDVMVLDLAAGNPSVVGLFDGPEAEMGHAYVVHAAEFSRRKNNLLDTSFSAAVGQFGGDRYAREFPLWSVHLIDPWTGEAVVLAAEDFAQRVEFIISAREAEQILRREAEAIRVR